MQISTRELFKKHRLRCTSQRVALYDALCKSHRHPTADELYRIVKNNAQSGSHMSRATVYNTLDALCKAGLARQLPAASIGNGAGGCRYDADLSDHLHFRCQATSEIRDIPEQLSKKLLANLPSGVIAEIEEVLGVKVEQVNMQLIGRSERASP